MAVPPLGRGRTSHAPPRRVARSRAPLKSEVAVRRASSASWGREPAPVLLYLETQPVRSELDADIDSVSVRMPHSVHDGLSPDAEPGVCHGAR